MYKLIVDHVKKSFPIFGTLGGVIGFITDILQPIAPFSNYAFMITSITTFILLLLIILMKNTRERIIPSFVFSFSLMAVSSFLLLFMNEEKSNMGVLSATIPGIGMLQESFGLIEKDIQSIKESVERIEVASQQTAANSEIIKDSLKDVQRGFAALTQSGGIIRNPEMPEQFYHNARIYELSGDYLNARKSYNAYFSFGLNFLDPHLRFQTFLKVQEGREGALEIYSYMYQSKPSMITEFSRTLLFKQTLRFKALNSFVERYPDFAPAYYELSKEFSEMRKGVQSNEDKVNERNSLNKFQELVSKGNFFKYFVDNEIASQLLNDTEVRLRLLNKNIIKDTVRLEPNYSDSGWMITLLIAEDFNEVFYKTKNDKDYISIGYDSLNSSPMIVVDKTDQLTLQVKYSDVNGQEQGPFIFNLDAKQVITRFIKSTLEDGVSKNNWISFREYQGALLVYFTQLVSNKCALSEIRYGVDAVKPKKIFKLKQCNLNKPYSTVDGEIYHITIPIDSEFISLQLIYDDGAESEIRIYPKKNHMMDF